MSARDDALLIAEADAPCRAIQGADLIGISPFPEEDELSRFDVCRNRAIDHHRKEKRMKVPADSQALERVPDTAPATANVLELQQAHSQILGALAALPKNQQEVVRLKFQNGLSYKEISRITGLSVSNVGFLLHTAMKTLRGSLGGDQ